jgi:hypothetical protein
MSKQEKVLVELEKVNDGSSDKPHEKVRCLCEGEKSTSVSISSL